MYFFFVKHITKICIDFKSIDPIFRVKSIYSFDKDMKDVDKNMMQKKKLRMESLGCILIQ